MQEGPNLKGSLESEGTFWTIALHRRPTPSQTFSSFIRKVPSVTQFFCIRRTVNPGLIPGFRSKKMSSDSNTEVSVTLYLTPLY